LLLRENDHLTPFRESQIPAVIVDALGVVLSLEEGDATTRFHQSRCWFSHYMAGGGARPAARANTAHWRAIRRPQ
jgi:hypothetical protein